MAHVAGDGSAVSVQARFRGNSAACSQCVMAKGRARRETAEQEQEEEEEEVE